MNFSSFLYNLIIFPLTQLLEFTYEFIYEATDNIGIAVISLSFAVTLCTLPLYMVAEKWSEVERNTQLKLKPGIKRIKEAFKGDEQYMILNTYYHQNHYNPIMGLRSSLSLLIQVPFFLAAYHYLSELGPLKDYSFLFIKDMGSADETFHIGNFAINVLPIAMTLINCISGIIYSKGHDIKEKIQIFAFAGIFLIILYSSPAGLVVYWTMNNILSLVKNIFYKLKNPKKVLYIILCFFSALCLISVFTVLKSSKDTFRMTLAAFAVLLPVIPFTVIYSSRLILKYFKSLDENPKIRCSIFFISCFILAILSGLVIPGMLIQSEPGNYCYVDSYKSPFVFLFTTFFQALGFFVFWPGFFYGIFSSKIKKVFCIFFSIISIGALINTFAFSGNYGPIYPELIFMQPQHFTPAKSAILLNAAVLLFASVLFILIINFWNKIASSILSILILSLLCVSVKDIFSIQSYYSKTEAPSYNNELEPIFHLSKNGKNVIVLMQDRCFMPFIPYVFEENPDLLKTYEGFKWYPNTVSMGRLTMIGTPGLFGGYDYTPYRMNQRGDEEPEKTLQQKHNEALLTLPALFSENGYKVQVANLPYENYLEQPESNMYTKFPLLELESYKEISDNSYIVKYKDHEEIQHNHVLATYTDYWYSKHNETKDPYISTQILRNFIWFSFFKMVPPVLRGGIYHRDYWLSYNKWDDSARFVDNYSVHDYLPELTDFYSDDKVKGSLVLLDNEATHEPILLEAPEYEYSKNPENNGNSILKMNTHFSTMCGVFRRFGEFLQYLKDNDVYDNTRIIIVSDHGMGDSNSNYNGATSIFIPQKDESFTKVNFVATLLVKDFDDRAEMSMHHIKDGDFSDLDMTFMTNADTPYLAAKDLFPEINPFTGKDLKIINKNEYSILNNSSAQSTRIRNDKKFNVKDNEWIIVKDNIYDDSNWYEKSGK